MPGAVTPAPPSVDQARQTDLLPAVDARSAACCGRAEASSVAAEPGHASAQILAYPTSVAALAFSRDGRTLAVAASYTYEQGDQPHPRDAIYLRPMADAETRPKKRAA